MSSTFRLGGLGIACAIQSLPYQVSRYHHQINQIELRDVIRSAKSSSNRGVTSDAGMQSPRSSQVNAVFNFRNKRLFQIVYISACVHFRISESQFRFREIETWNPLSNSSSNQEALAKYRAPKRCPHASFSGSQKLSSRSEKLLSESTISSSR